MALITKRPRRNRKSAAVRLLSQENHLVRSDIVVPLFVVDGAGIENPISSMPGIYRRSLDKLLLHVHYLVEQGIHSIALFPVIDPMIKTPNGTEALSQDGIIPRAIANLKNAFPELLIISDIALDPYTTHAHDGILNEKGHVDNDLTVQILCKQALVHAKAGADIVAPSDMMDGRVKAIREALDSNEYQETSVLAYTVKYASSLYSPFRSAIKTPKNNLDKTTYQLNPANAREALLEAALDEQEGADLLMVKPGSLYLDVLSSIRNQTHLPVGIYHVSGEYAAVMAAAEKGYLNASNVFYETLISMKRAGADFIFTYASEHVLKFI